MFSMATVASSTRMPTASARPPSVMTLMVWPAPHNAITAASSAKGMVTTTMPALRQSRRKTSTINSRQKCSEPRLTKHGLERRRDVARLIQFIAHLDVVRNQRLETTEVRLDLAHHAQCRRVRALRHRNVDGAPAIHQGVRRRNVSTIGDAADVADRDRRARARAYGQFQQVIDI